MPPSPRKSSIAIDLAELETFIAVAELGSFSAAATRLHVGQPSVTSRVKRLEAALGTPLLIRNTRNVVPTPDGARLLLNANGALGGLRTVVKSLLDNASQARQRVVVASTPILAATVLPPLIRDYAVRFTDVELQLLDLRYADVLEALESGAADVAIVSDDSNGRFRTEPLGSDEVVLVIPPTHALNGAAYVGLEQLEGEDLIMIDQYHPIYEAIIAAMRERHLRLPHFASVSNISTLIGMLDAGMGMALMARASGLRRQPKGDSIAVIDTLNLRRNYALLFPRKAEPGTAVQSFCQFLRESLVGKWPLRPTTG
ncbi:MAG: LysR family transcriptional regulator [Variovorax sp.]